MKLKASLGNIYGEYIVAFVLVVIFCVASYQYIANTITGVIIGSYQQGNKIRISLSGITFEKAGKYGGTKTSPVYFKNDTTGRVSLDFGYFVIDDIEENAPLTDVELNPCGSETLRYYARILDKLEWELSSSETTQEDAGYIRTLSELTYGMAYMIDNLYFYSGQKASLTSKDKNVRLSRVNIRIQDDGGVIVSGYKVYPQGFETEILVPGKNFDMVNKVGFLYTSATRCDNGAPIFIWLTKDDIRQQQGSYYTFEEYHEKYTQLENVAAFDLGLLRLSESEKTGYISPKSYKNYVLLRMFDIYRKIIDKSSQNEVTKIIVNTVCDDIESIVNNIEISTTNAKTIKVGLSPQIALESKLPEKIINNVKNPGEKDQKAEI